MKLEKKLIIMMVFSSALYGSQKKDIDLKSSQVELPWNEFSKIIDKITAPINLQLPDTLLPENGFLFSSAKIKGTVINRKAARFSIQCELVIPVSAALKSNGWIKVPIGTREGTNPDYGVLERAELNNTYIPVLHDDEFFYVLISKSGRYVLSLYYYCPLSNEEGNWKITFSTPKAASAMLDFYIPGIQTDLWINGNKKKVDISADGTKFNSVLSLEDQLSIRYSQIGEELADDESNSTVSPKSFAISGLLVSIKENRINYHYKVDYQIWHQRRNSFSVEIPESLQIENVQGSGISEWVTEKKNGKAIVMIHTTFIPEQSYTFTIDAYQKLKTAESDINIPVLQVLNVNRYSGYIGVNASKAIEVSTGNEMKNITGADPDEVPEWLYAQSDNLKYYVFNRTPYQIGLSIKRHQDIPVLVALADEALCTGIITEKGYCLIKYKYFIRNNHKQYLKVSTPQGWQLWSALIDDNAVLPASSPSGKEIMIPLKKLSKSEEGAGFTLELVFWNQGKKLTSSGTLKLITPVIDINCQKIYGDIYLPDKYSYSGFSGSIQIVSSFVTRYLSTSQMTTRPSFPKQYLSIVKGNPISLPVEIEIPTVGTPIRFTKSLTIAGEKSELCFRYKIPLSLTWIRSMIVWSLIFTIGLISVIYTLKIRKPLFIVVTYLSAMAVLTGIYFFSSSHSLNISSISTALLSGIIVAGLKHSSNRKAGSV